MSTTLIIPVRLLNLRCIICRALITHLSIHEPAAEPEAVEWTNCRLLTDARMLCQWGLVA